MGSEKSNNVLLKEILLEYVFKVKYTRKLFFPNSAAGDTKLPDLHRDISQSTYLYISIVLGELQSFFIRKAGQTEFRLVNKNTYGRYIGLAPGDLLRKERNSEYYLTEGTGRT